MDGSARCTPNGRHHDDEEGDDRTDSSVDVLPQPVTTSWATIRRTRLEHPEERLQDHLLGQDDDKVEGVLYLRARPDACEDLV